MYQSITVGKLNKRITFVERGEIEDEIGQIKQGFRDVRTVWATVKALRGGEYYEAQKLRPETTYKITTRYHAGITPDMMIRYNGKLMEILTVQNVSEANTMLEIQAVEYIKKGASDGGIV